MSTIEQFQKPGILSSLATDKQLEEFTKTLATELKTVVGYENMLEHALSLTNRTLSKNHTLVLLQLVVERQKLGHEPQGLTLEESLLADTSVQKYLTELSKLPQVSRSHPSPLVYKQLPYQVTALALGLCQTQKYVLDILVTKYLVSGYQEEYVESSAIEQVLESFKNQPLKVAELFVTLVLDRGKLMREWEEYIGPILSGPKPRDYDPYETYLVKFLRKSFQQALTVYNT